eukprot:516961_1
MTTCNDVFIKCKAATRIKSVLEQFNQTISDKNEKSVGQLQENTIKLINNVLIDGQYSNVELLNDFYHIKYDHNANEDPDKFNLFRRYLFDNDNVLQCDVNDCKSMQRYYRQRDQISQPICPSQHTKHSNIHQSYTLNLLCRIHSYFIHSYELLELNKDEIEYVHSKLINELNEEKADKKLELMSKILCNKKPKLPYSINNNKYITTDNLYIDSAKIVSLLQSNDININTNQLQLAFDHCGYNQPHLIDDLCDILLNDEDEQLLVTIITNDLSFHDKYKRKQIYDLILHGIIQKHELNTENFIKILKVTALKINSSIQPHEIEKIAIQYHLTGNLFLKKTKEFMSSLKFAKCFKSIKNYDKKQWCEIYRNIHKWTLPKPKTKVPTPIKSTKNESANTKNESANSDDIKSELDEKKTFHDENKMNYIYTISDMDIIHRFCALTNCAKNIAISFLNASQWALNVALNKYYSCNGNIISSD